MFPASYFPSAFPYFPMDFTPELVAAGPIQVEFGFVYGPSAPGFVYGAKATATVLGPRVNGEIEG